VKAEKTKYVLMSRNQKTGKRVAWEWCQVLWRCGKVQIPRNNANRSKLHARRD
jgi:hypothetical protein